jgi:hypothetical protein
MIMHVLLDLGTQHIACGSLPQPPFINSYAWRHTEQCG